ncbi:OTU domain-containing protein [Paenibacillus flagellatus]|uniref:OTU domain-containing protein n=1 Tax=Paenibacillus flagellatus TaxID=2211139 RepID=A0A2V5JXB8_9BACL|nr:OTU domain-containing protein [Paenibacillus flagellatus]PYI51495.1 hypothetical protein DLM86_24015 [Paenibacillus flagellatus]
MSHHRQSTNHFAASPARSNAASDRTDAAPHSNAAVRPGPDRLGPGMVRPANVAALQRTVGNRAISRYMENRVLVQPARDKGKPAKKESIEEEKESETEIDIEGDNEFDTESEIDIESEAETGSESTAIEEEAADSSSPLAQGTKLTPSQKEEINVVFWNIQGKGEFRDRNVESFLKAFQNLDIVILGEYKDKQKTLNIDGWTTIKKDITPLEKQAEYDKMGPGKTRRSKGPAGSREYIVILVNENRKVKVDDAVPIPIRENWRQAVSFNADKNGQKASFTTFHAPYEQNKGSASQYMGELKNKVDSNVLIGDANTYNTGHRAPDARKSERLQNNERYTLKSGGLPSSRANQPLDKVYAGKNFTGVKDVKLLSELLRTGNAGGDSSVNGKRRLAELENNEGDAEELLKKQVKSENAGMTKSKKGRPVRQSVTKNILDKIMGLSDHRPIYAHIELEGDSEKENGSAESQLYKELEKAKEELGLDDLALQDLVLWITTRYSLALDDYSKIHNRLQQALEAYRKAFPKKRGKAKEGDQTDSLLQRLHTEARVTVEIDRVPGNGDCLFSSIAAITGGSAGDVRGLIADELHAHENELVGRNNPVVVSGADTISKLFKKNAPEGHNGIYMIPRNDYPRVMRQPGVWGGVPELRAFSYRRAILVLNAAENRFNFFDGGVELQGMNLAVFMGRNPVVLLLRGNHFSPLRIAPNPSAVGQRRKSKK